MIRATINAWANALGKDADTIRRALTRKNKQLPKPGKPVSAKQIFDALTESRQDPKQRLLEAQAQAQERANRLAENETCQWADVERLLNEKVFGPLTTAFDSAPTAVEREWIEKTLKPLVRVHLEGPK